MLELHTEDLNLETYREPSPITTSGINWQPEALRMTLLAVCIDYGTAGSGY